MSRVKIDPGFRIYNITLYPLDADRVCLVLHDIFGVQILDAPKIFSVNRNSHKKYL